MLSFFVLHFSYRQCPWADRRCDSHLHNHNPQDTLGKGPCSTCYLLKYVSEILTFDTWPLQDCYFLMNFLKPKIVFFLKKRKKESCYYILDIKGVAG